MDDDLQQRPDQLPKLLRALQAEPELDCVFGYFEEKKHAAYRNLGSRAICWLNARAFALPRGARTSSFVAMRRRLAKAVLQHRTVNPAIGVLVFRCTRKIASVPVEHGERFAGESNYTLSKQFRVAMDIICNVTMLPLRAISLIGMGSCLFSAMLVAVFLYRYFAGEIAVAGWTTVVILISFFSGSILLSLGMIGEYLVRILREVRGAPGYLIRETLTYPGITKTGGIDVRQDVSDDAVYRQLAELCEEILSDQHQADCGASAQREPMELT